AEDGIRDFHVTGVQTCALPILLALTVASSGATWGSGPASRTATVRASSNASGTINAMGDYLRDDRGGASARPGRADGSVPAAPEIGRASCRERVWGSGGGESGT